MPSSGEQHLLKVYSDRSYVHTTTVRHQGTTVALAMDDQRRLVYTVLDLARHDEAKGELDAAYWSENPLPLRFPGEISDVGYGAVGATALPVVKQGGRVEAAPGERLDDEEVDPFLSTTARLTAAAPFHALSDGTHIVVLRQSLGVEHPDGVHKLTGGGSSGDPERTDYAKDRAGAKVPLVADTLLCDRFLLVGGELKPVLEARYRRSRHRTRPDSAKDSLGTTDMEGRPFHEPTQELSFVRHLSGGRFTTLLVPTAVHGQQRWQIFAHNDATGRIDSFNVEQGRDGLFNLQGTQAWTSPDPEYRDAVYESGPGTCPFTGQPLVPVVSTSGYAETALAFGEADSYVRVAEGLTLAGTDFTVEFWARRTGTGRQEFLVGHGDQSGKALKSLHIGFREDDRFTFAFYADDLNSDVTTTDTDWHHWACVYDRTTRRQTVYRDGESVGTRITGGDYTGTGPLLLGRALGQGARAELDEVRIWNRARTADELKRDKGIRLIGNDPGLIAYYRFDEGSGTRLHDQTDSARHGELVGSPTWVTSEAPIGDHPGVRRDSFAVTGRTTVSGLSAVLYHQQEDTSSGYGQEPKPAKRQARVLLSYATGGPDPKSGAATEESYLATVDFGVGRDGRLAQIPDELTLPVLAAPEGSANVETISELDGRIRELVRDITAKEAEVADLTRQTADVPELERLRGLFYTRSQDFLGWSLRLRFRVSRDGKDQYLAVKGDGSGQGDYPRVIRTSDKDAKSALWSIVMPPGSSWNGSMLYYLRNIHTGKDLNVLGDSRDDDVPLIVYPRQSGAWNTLFGIYEQTDGSVLLTNRKSEKTVCAPDQLGDGVVQRDSTGMANYAAGLIILERVALYGGHPDIADAVKRVEALDAQLAELRPKRELLAERQREIAAHQVELAAKRDELARLTGGLKGADDIALPMPQLFLDRTGLSCSGALLAFARSADRPYLLDSATGNVVLYFRGSNGQFFAAYYDTSVVRSSRQLTAGDGRAVTFTARDSGTDLGAVRVRVTEGDEPGLCDVTIERGEESETWKRLPRRAADFAAIVNGAPDEPATVGAVKSFDATTRLLSGGKAGDVVGGVLRLAEALSAALPARTPVTVGGHLYLTETDHAAGATSLRLGDGEGGPEPQPGEPVQRLRYDHRSASSNCPGVPLFAGSRLVLADPGAAQEVPLGEMSSPVAGHGCRWRADKPGRAYSFDGRKNLLSLPEKQLDRAAVTRDLTLEAWINPEQVSGAARIVNARTGEAPYTLGLLAPAAEVVPALAFDGKSGVAMTENGFSLAGQDFTVEFWARRTTAWEYRPHYLVGHGSSQAATRGSLHIGFRDNSAFTFAFYGDDLTTNHGNDDTDWHHWACVFNAATREQVIYKDGVEEGRRVASGVYQGDGLFSFGSHFGSWVAEYAEVEMDEVRLWGTARTAAEVREMKNRRLSGTESGLMGYWPYADQAPQVGGKPGVLDRSGQGRHVYLRGGVTTATAPAALDREAEAAYRVVAGVGDRLVATRDTFPLHEWSHLAAAYEQSWAVELSDGAYLEAPDNDALDIPDDLTVEVFCRVDVLGTTQGLLSKGRAADGSGDSVPYRLLVLPDGKLEFGFEEPGGRIVRFTSTEALRAGTFHRIGIVRKSGRSMQERKGTKEITAAGADGKPVKQTVELVESVDVQEWQDIRFHIDGREAGTARYEGPGPKGNTGTLDIGRAREGLETYAFAGVVAEVRLWGAARDAAQLGTPVSARDRGLTAHWRFEENAGNTAADSTGSHALRLRGARWTRNPDPRGSAFRIYRNGVSVACDPLESTEFADYGDAQLSLGARTEEGGRPGQPFHGILEEVRIWRTARTQEEVLDNLFSRLKGEKEDLIAYWPFDRDSTDEAAALVRDEGLRGNHLELHDGDFRPVAVLSTAPVSTDTAQVRSALAAMRTPFHETVTGSPAVAEYADMQYTAKGEAFGVLKRAYAYLRDGRWHLVTGYKVGDLVSEWVSQVQFDPQLIGYVEGAPPVPSENLTPNTIDPERSTYDGIASVELTQAEEVVHSLSSAKERSVDAAFGFALSNEIDVDVWMITAPLGFGIAKSMVTAKVSAGVRGSLEFSNSWAEETAVSQGENTARAMKVDLSGSWEDPLKPLNPALGRRYIPVNTGFAVVQSQTADVFALRLAHTDALVAYRIQPSPDIPKDWNVIPFPLNPRYTKQGTLDGTVGFDERGKVLDPDCTTARDHGEYSYYKPREAYAVKRRIQREQQRLRGYYESVSTETHTPDPTAERAGRVLGGAIGGDTAPGRGRDTAGSTTGDGFSRRDLVNTYVWTADGGFFAETTETTDVVTETTSGSYSLTGSVGASIGTSFDVMGIGVNAQLDASIGGGMSVSRARGKEATRSFGLNVSCSPSGNLQQYDAGRKPVFDAEGRPVNAPGKVDAYRFLSFYLGEDTEHFDTFFHKVVDPAWLDGAHDPNAAALRQARQSDRKPPCWRVMHRVTFVSRLLPPVAAADAAPLERTMRQLDVESNYELVRRLDPYVKGAATGLPELSAAVREAVAAHLPELLPHADEVIGFLAQYYGVEA